MARLSEISEHAIRIVLGSAFFIGGLLVVMRSGGFGALLFVPMGAILGTCAALCFLPYITAPMERSLGALFFPSGKRIRLRHDFCDIRAKLARGELADAAEKLRTDIDEHPERAQEARVLLAEVLYENLDRPDEAMEAVRCGLAVPEWSDEMERLARLGADILSERNDASGARELLEGAIAGAGSAAAADRLRDRLKHLG